MPKRVPDSNAPFVEIRWSGPFAWGPDGLTAGLDPFATNEHLSELYGKAGIYMILGDHPVHGEKALLYLGETNRFGRRIEGEHASWIAHEWRVEVYLGVPDPPKLRKEVEQWLIYAHSPAYNWRSKGGRPSVSLRIWNVGRFHRLLPEISSSHPWYDEA